VREELWSRLCHQGTVYSASFAALPVLIDVAEQWKPKERSQLIALAASILASKDVSGGCRDDFLRPVEWVVPRFHRFCRESLAESGLSKHDFIYLLQAARSFEGDQCWGQELDHLASGEFPGQCPHCGVELYLVIGEYGFFTTAEEWVMRFETPRTEPGTIKVRPGIKRTPIEPNTDGKGDIRQYSADRQSIVGCPLCLPLAMCFTPSSRAKRVLRWRERCENRSGGVPRCRRGEGLIHHNTRRSPCRSLRFQLSAQRFGPFV
jgi:hypothetical protein